MLRRISYFQSVLAAGTSGGYRLPIARRKPRHSKGLRKPGFLYCGFFNATLIPTQKRFTSTRRPPCYSLKVGGKPSLLIIPQVFRLQDLLRKWVVQPVSGPVDPGNPPGQSVPGPPRFNISIAEAWASFFVRGLSGIRLTGYHV